VGGRRVRPENTNPLLGFKGDPKENERRLVLLEVLFQILVWGRIGGP